MAFDPEPGRIDFHLTFASGTRFACPHCGAEHQPVHDTLERDWRHLHFFQLQAYIHARVPRVRCPMPYLRQDYPQVGVPWARPNSGFTRRMEALLVTLCKAMTVSQVAQLPSVSDGRVWRTLDHYVDQAHAQEDFSTVTSVGLDETASRRGYNYMSLFHDLDAPRGLYACEGRKAQVVAQFAGAFEAHGACAENIRAVCKDMSTSYQAGVCEHRPWATITFDEFHIIQLVNKAVDEVRRQEVKRAPELRCTRYIWLKDKSAWSNRQTAQFADLKSRNLKTHRAFRIQGTLHEIFHSAQSAVPAEPLLVDKWYSWARRCRLEPIKAVAKILKDYWPSVLNAFDSRLTNGHVEGVNSLIQTAKARARGYGTAKHLINIAYLVADKLTPLPTSPFVVKSGLPLTT